VRNLVGYIDHVPFREKKVKLLSLLRKRCSAQYSSIVSSDKGRWSLCSFTQVRRTDRNGLFLHFSSSRNQF